MREGFLGRGGVYYGLSRGWHWAAWVGIDNSGGGGGARDTRRDKMADNGNTVKGIRKIGTFITADALLAAVLMVWAQLWIQPTLELWIKYYQPVCGNIGEWFDKYNDSNLFGLLLTYPAILLALVALAWAVWHSLNKSSNNKSDETPKLSLGLFGAAISMAILNVSQFVLSAVYKTFSGTIVYEFYDMEKLPPVFINIFIRLSVAFIICTGICFGFSPINSKVKYIPIVLFVAIGILGIIGYIFFLK